MSKISGRLLTMYISPTGVRVIEGELRNGDLDIRKYFKVAGMSEFFDKSGSEYELSSVGGMVAAICSELDNRKVSTKKILLCSGVLDSETSIAVNSGPTGILAELTKQRGVEDKPKTVNDPSKIKSTVEWGSLVIDGKVARVSTTLIGDKYLYRSIAEQFNSYGYEIIGIMDTVSALMYLHYTEGAEFDSQGKVIFSVNEINTDVITLSKDIPYRIESLKTPSSGLSEFISMQIRNAENDIGRNPRVYVTGDLMSDCSVYNELIDTLSTTCNVYDLFDHPEPDFDEESGELSDVLSADYTPCLALLLSTQSKKIVNVLPPKTLSAQIQQYVPLCATIVLVSSILACAFCTSAAVTRFFQVSSIKANPVNISGLQSQITVLNTKKQDLNDTISTLTRSDATILKIIDFVSDSQTADVHVISVDTADMLYKSDVEVESDTEDVTESSSTTHIEEEEEVLEGSTGDEEESPITTRENVIIRGYATSGTAAVNYYNRLFNLGLDYDPVLNGVEKYSLPDGSEVYIFEIEVGGGVK